MSNVIPFQFQGHAVRVVEHDGEPWFVAKDVAEVLGYSRPADAIRAHCKGVGESPTPSAGGMQTVKIIPERDVYRLIMRSRLPEAERFEEWVVGEVLPSIRKHGGYIDQQEADSPEIILAKAMKVAESVLEEKQRLIEQQQEKLTEAEPKVEFYDKVTNSHEAITVAEAAKILGTGQKRLYAFLRKIGWVARNNEPYQRRIEQGLLDVKLRHWEHPKLGDIRQSVTATVTGKGLAKLQKLWAESEQNRAA